ncbi:MAG: hypothetical protein PHG48_07245, partial [Eubacteriales bacterium]|nr:hypothetical protein [Eubacteriales bacterium]
MSVKKGSRHIEGSAPVRSDRLIDIWDMPLYKAVVSYAAEGHVVFHMPGHKGGRGFCVEDGSMEAEVAKAEYLYHAAMIDLTETPFTDNLHSPEGVIKRAQELAAEAFGADRTFFLVNGSTCGIQAAIAAICGSGGVGGEVGEGV